MRWIMAAIGAALLAGCGGNLAQSDARDDATEAGCDWYAKCGEIGAGKKYETRDSCEVDVRKSWNDLWPLADCDRRIPPEKLDVCLAAIEITECGNGMDFLNTVFNKCGKSAVCSAPAP